MAVPVLDTSAFPLIVSRFPPDWAPEELDAYFERFRELHDGGLPFVHINDLSRVGPMVSRQMRTRAATFIAAEADRSEHLCRGAVHIVPSLLIRAALAAVHWAAPPPYAHAVVADEAQAWEWARRRAAEEGMDLPVDDDVTQAVRARA